MWQRRTFHECASELSAISEDFRSAYTNRFNWDRAKRDRVLSDTSTRGVEVLRILALSIRSDQDAGLTVEDKSCVGAIVTAASEAEASRAMATYQPPYQNVAGSKPLRLRQALNKIAHADPKRSGFFADERAHDLVLTGQDHGQIWIAVISLIDLCHVVKALPDASTRA